MDHMPTFNDTPSQRSNFRFELCTNNMLQWLLSVTTCSQFQAQCKEEIANRREEK